MVLLSGCEKTVNIDIPQKEPKLVINARLVKNEVFSVSAGRSRGVLSPVNYSSSLIEQYVVKTAAVVVFENGTAIDTLVYQPGDFLYKSVRNTRVQDGKVYTVAVSAAGYTTAQASAAVPSQSVIAGVTRIRNSRTTASGTPQDEITIKLSDPPGERNFYLVQLWGAGFGNPFGNSIYCVSTTDKDVEDIGDNTDPFDPDNCYDGGLLLMRDDNFNGGLKQLRLFVDASQLDEYNDPVTHRIYRPYIHVYRISEDEFKYNKSNNAYTNTGDNPFAEPINIFSNVKNGYGIFSLSTVAVDTLR
ncbi:MAG: DUF4249 domain-containing protein [Bacteroidetes bacterium]|nr:DUF4249 domain-containing protein [Bacteroidota bacterium]